MLTPDEKEIVKGITDRDGGRGVVVEAGMSIDKQSAGHYTGGVRTRHRTEFLSITGRVYKNIGGQRDRGR